MVKCLLCQVTYIDNTVFCSECGSYLLKDDKRETDPVGINKISRLGHPKIYPAPDLLLQPGSGPMSIRLTIGAKKREIEVTLTKAIHLGRLDAALDVFPEIDLTNDGAGVTGVSRRHARILKRGARVVIEDLGSINGTFLNGKRLDPYFPETLKDGDFLQLGKLPLEVKIHSQ